MNIIDLHCDTLSQMVKLKQSLLSNCLHFDVKRARNSGLKVQFMALFAHPDEPDICLRKILLQVNSFQRALQENSALTYQLKTFGQIDEAENQEKLGCLLHLEGGEALGQDIELLHLLYSLGLRSMGLTWNPPNMLGGGVDAGNEGLTSLGRSLIKDMEDLGILLDLAHLGQRSFFEAIECYRKPVIVTHANAFAVCPNRRNLTDSQFKAVAENEGIIGFTLVSDFVRKDGQATAEDFVDHIAYAAELIGTRCLALGSDFDGADRVVLPGVEAYQNLPHLLEQGGFNKAEISQILWENAMRVLKQII